MHSMFANLQCKTRMKTPVLLVFLTLMSGNVFAAQDIVSTLKVEPIVAKMVDIPAGIYRMGDTVGDGSKDEKPVHVVEIKAFRMGAYEVTFDEYDAYAHAIEGKGAVNNDHFVSNLPDDNGWGRGNRPVFNVSWDEAQGYITWLNEQTGRHFRLPTAAEWEYAARAGTVSNYYWGDKFVPIRANGANSVKQTTPVGQYPANQFGLYDMVGNVYEWVQDCYHSSYEGAPKDGSAWISGADCERRRVTRGGSWGSDAINLRLSNHYAVNITSRNGSLGFRLAEDK